MKQYEIAYFLSPDIKEEEATSVYLQKLKDAIFELGGEIIKESPVQKKKLAYDIKKASQGYFGYMLFNINSENVKLLDKKLKLEDYILRYLVISVDKKYSAHMKRQEEEIKEKFQKITQEPGGEVSKKAIKSRDEDKEKIEEEIEKKLEEILG